MCIRDSNKLILLAAKLVSSTLCPRPSPTVFYYSGLTAKQFHDKNSFGFISKIEENTSIIANEFTELRKVYKVNDYRSEDKEHVLLKGSMQWMQFTESEKSQNTVRKLCPKTSKLLSSIPEILAGTSLGSSYFSVLGPKSTLKPHSGPSNIKLRCHLPLFPVGDSFLRVGGEFKQWEVGKLLIFDESFVHEEENIDADKERIILVFDIWHPDLRKEERALLQTEYENLSLIHS
eukprot:TRINITY_DN19097_c0_g1_i2.p1 TRINITY_DN19097_c0_g1~~TRINITY_DN19097_c0_g1_i2.p1  ORF type:complete len:254 (-),score=49.11 TRINITY_DN19097_c0_g1_i2:15-713(-)